VALILEQYTEKIGRRTCGVAYITILEKVVGLNSQKKHPMVAFCGRMVLTYDLPEPWRLFRTCSRSEEETEMSNPVNVRLVFVRFEGRNLVRCYDDIEAVA